MNPTPSIDHNESQDAANNLAVAVALAYRLAAISAMRTTIIPAILIFGALSWHLGRWFPLLVTPLVVWTAFVATSIHATHKVLRLTGISRSSQRVLLARYKSDPVFARQIDIAVQDPNLLG